MGQQMLVAELELVVVCTLETLDLGLPPEELRENRDAAGGIVRVGRGLVERVADSQDNAEAAGRLVLERAIELVGVLDARLHGMSLPLRAGRESRRRATALAIGQRPEAPRDESGARVDEQRFVA